LVGRAREYSAQGDGELGEVFARHGARHPLGEGFSGSQDLVPHAFDEKTALSHTAQVPPPVVREDF
jgi:phthiodiolone/phenolphthiodiolone dimycocerosates ketoreductase